LAPRYIIRDRDAVYAEVFIRRLRAMSISANRAAVAVAEWIL